MPNSFHLERGPNLTHQEINRRFCFKNADFAATLPPLAHSDHNVEEASKTERFPVTVLHEIAVFTLQMRFFNPDG